MYLYQVITQFALKRRFSNIHQSVYTELFIRIILESLVTID